MPTSLQGRAKKAAHDTSYRLRHLVGMLTVASVLSGWPLLKKRAATGGDRISARAYGNRLHDHVTALVERVKNQCYRAKVVRRHSIPKGNGALRPLGIPTLEDTIVQRATVEVLNAIDEKAWLGFSSGARPGRSPHHAWDAVTVGSEKRPINWGLDVDMRGLYDAMDHAWLVKCVEHRMGGQRVVRHVRTWRKAGVLEDGQWRQQEAGMPQGSSASPLRAHRSLHEVLDLWAAQWRRRRARGEVSIVRDCDDCIVGFQDKDDAEQCLSDLRERCHRVRLALHPEKTRRMV